MIDNKSKYPCIECGKEAKWLYMPGDEESSLEDGFYCDDCVSRGCSCNEESLYFNDEHEDKEELFSQAKSLRERINTYSYIMINYGKKEHCCGKELETIKDIKLIRNIVNNVTCEQLRHFTFKPLDEKGREYPCCEFEYSENGFLKSDFEEVETNV